MTSSVFEVFLYTLIPLAAAAVGGTTSMFWKPGPRAGSAIQHFAAGRPSRGVQEGGT
ncbi:MAG: hypothetical protein ACP5XB_15135 [Isosphaeraceae bacterium]